MGIILPQCHVNAHAWFEYTVVKISALALTRRVQMHERVRHTPDILQSPCGRFWRVAEFIVIT